MIKPATIPLMVIDGKRASTPPRPACTVENKWGGYNGYPSPCDHKRYVKKKMLYRKKGEKKLPSSCTAKKISEGAMKELPRIVYNKTNGNILKGKHPPPCTVDKM